MTAVFTRPTRLRTRSKHVVDTAKLMHAPDVSIKPTPRASRPKRCCASTAPKASQQAEPAFSSADMAQIVATAAARLRPRGQDVGIFPASRSFGGGEAGDRDVFGSSTKAAVMAAANSEPADVTPTTVASDDDEKKSRPPKRGPTMNANVDDASRHASHRGSCSSVAASAR